MSNEPLIVSLRTPQGRPAVPPESRVPPRGRRKLPVKLIVGVLMLALSIGLIIYFRDSIPGVSSIGQVGSAAQSSQEQEREVADLVEAVGNLIVLPEGEEPTVASVTDPEKLKDQPFFHNAKAGDKVLIYTKARKAYLYDPKLEKLLEVAPLTVESTP